MGDNNINRDKCEESVFLVSDSNEINQQMDSKKMTWDVLCDLA